MKRPGILVGIECRPATWFCTMLSKRIWTEFERLEQWYSMSPCLPNIRFNPGAGRAEDPDAIVRLAGNFPMALDEASHRVFVATRSPARLVVFDADLGHVVTTLPAVQDADDLYFDAERKRIYIPGGEGYISVFRQRDADHYDLLAKIQPAVGARTAGYFGKMGKKGFDRLYLAVPARAGRQAEVRIYTVQD
jgi:hypothetical protein